MTAAATVTRQRAEARESAATIGALTRYFAWLDPRTHRVYLPLENVGEHPLLRVYEPAT